MTIDERTSGGVIILAVRGRMTIDDMGNVLVVDKVRQFLRDGQKHVLVDLAAVPYVDTTGLRDIVEAYIASRRQGGSLKLLNLTPRVRHLLVITRLLTVIEAFESEADAVASFGSSDQA